MRTKCSILYLRARVLCIDCLHWHCYMHRKFNALALVRIHDLSKLSAGHQIQQFQLIKNIHHNVSTVFNLVIDSFFRLSFYFFGFKQKYRPRTIIPPIDDIATFARPRSVTLLKYFDKPVSPCSASFELAIMFQ